MRFCLNQVFTRGYQIILTLFWLFTALAYLVYTSDTQIYIDIYLSYVDIQRSFCTPSKGPSVFTSSSFYLWFKRRGGRGVEASENGKLEEKPEENGVGGGSINIKLEEYIQTLRKRWSKYIKFSSFHFKIFHFTKGGVTVIQSS